MRNKKVLMITQAAMIAALYVVLTFIANALGLANGNIQVRLSEALTVLPFFTPAAIPGLVVGCFLSNILTGCCLLDIVCGSIATLIGALLSYALRKNKYLVTLPPVLANAAIVPWVLRYGYSVPLSIPFMAFTVAVGEVISCCVLGSILIRVLERYRGVIFGRTAAM